MDLLSCCSWVLRQKAATPSLDKVDADLTVRYSPLAIEFALSLVDCRRRIRSRMVRSLALSLSRSIDRWRCPRQNITERMDKLETTVKASAAKLDGPVGGVELREYQLQLLARLREIRGAC